MPMAQVGLTRCLVGGEDIKELVEQSVKNVQKDGPVLLKEERIKLSSKSSRHNICNKAAASTTFSVFIALHTVHMHIHITL